MERLIKKTKRHTMRRCDTGAGKEKSETFSKNAVALLLLYKVPKISIEITPTSDAETANTKCIQNTHNFGLFTIKKNDLSGYGYTGYQSDLFPATLVFNSCKN